MRTKVELVKLLLETFKSMEVTPGTKHSYILNGVRVNALCGTVYRMHTLGIIDWVEENELIVTLNRYREACGIDRSRVFWFNGENPRAERIKFLEDLVANLNILTRLNLKRK